MTQGTIDPLALWRNMLGQWHAAFNETAGKNLAPVEFARFMSQTMDMSAQLQQGFGVAMGRYLSALNMPTRGDLAGLDARLRAVEEQLARLNQQLARLADNSAVPATEPEPEPPRAKRSAPPAPSHQPESAATVAQGAAQPARAAKPARRSAKKQAQAAS